MKKALSAVLAVVLVLGVCFSVPMIASATDADDFDYKLTDDGYVITGYNGEVGANGIVTIPATYTLGKGESIGDGGVVVRPAKSNFAEPNKEATAQTATETVNNFKISCEYDDAEGTVAIAVDTEDATKAIVTITPKDTHNFVSIKVGEKDAVLASSITQSEGVYTYDFIPEENTTVVVVFEEKQAEPTEFTVTITDSENGSVTAKVGDVEIASGDKVDAGSDIVLTIAPDENYKLASLMVNDVEKKTDVSENTCTIADVNADVEIEATFELIPVTKYVIAGTGDVMVEETKVGTIATVEDTAAGDEVTLEVTPEEGYALKSLVVYKTGDEDTKVPVSNNKFTMPNYNVTVEAEFVAVYAIKVAELTGGSVEVKKEAENEEDVTITVKPNKGYALVADSLKVTKAEGEVETTVDANDANKFTFKMVAEAVTVTAEFTKINYQVTFKADTNATITLDKTENTVGEKITVTVAPKSKAFVCTGVKAVYGEGENDFVTATLVEDNYEFVIPEIDGDATFEVVATVVADTLDVVRVEEGVFAEKTGIKAFALEEREDDKVYFTVVDGVLFSADGKTLLAYPDAATATEYTIPADVTAIAEGAFAKCEALEYVFTAEGSALTLEDIAENNGALTAAGVLHLGKQGHDKVKDTEKSVAPTCIKAGTIKYKCSVVGCTYEYDKTDTDPIVATAHTYGDWTPRTAATCTLDGVEVKTCTNTDGDKVCGHQVKNIIPATQKHVIGEGIFKTEADKVTCEKDGTYTYICTQCNEYEFTTNEITAANKPLTAEKLKHKITGDNITAIKDATCKDAGYIKGYCDHGESCDYYGEIITIDIDAKDPKHENLSKEVIDLEPTCTEKGLKHFECEYCGYKGAKQEISALKHSDPSKVKWEVEAEATCEKAGLMVKYCENCGEILKDEDGKEYKRTIAATGHNYDEENEVVVAEATCMANGEKKNACTVCGKEKTEEIPKLTTHAYKFIDENKDGIADDSSWTEDEAATCKKVGKESRHCTVEGCTEKTDVRDITMLAHVADDTWEVVEGQEATCYRTGLKKGKCTVCEQEDVTIVIPMLAHDFGELEDIRANTTVKTTITNADGEEEEITCQAATCEDPGYKVKYCKNAGCTEYTEVTAQEKYGHKKATKAELDEVNAIRQEAGLAPITITTDASPTCEGEGTDYEFCKECRTVYGTPVDATGHAWAEEAVNLVEDIEIADEYGDKTIYKAATCTKAGWAVKYCEECDEADITTLVKIPELGHEELNETWTADETPATCIKKQFETNECKVCHEPLKRDIGDFAAHDWAEEKTVVSTQSCTTDGLSYYACNTAGCEERKDEVVDKATGHVWATAEEIAKLNEGKTEADEGYIKVPANVDAKCLDKGYEYGYCEECKDVIPTEIDPIGHLFADKYTEIEAPTCKKPGSKARVCTRTGCKVTTTPVVVKELGHEWEEDYTIDQKSTCSNPGSKSIHCVRYEECETSKEGSEVTLSKADHTYDENNWTTIKIATCFETGLQENFCSVCNKAGLKEDEEGNKVDGYTTKVLEKKEHTWSDDVSTTPASCTETGSRYKTCTRVYKIDDKYVPCTGTYEVAEIPATGHTLEAGFKTIGATCEAGGYDIGTCTNDGCTEAAGQAKANLTSALGHDWQGKVEYKAPTCTEGGSKTGKCSRCGDNTVVETIPAIKHNFEGAKWEVVDGVDCTTSGSKIQKCTVEGCDGVNEGIVGEHAETEWKITKKATCTAAGEMVERCVACKTVISEEPEVITAKGHKYVKEVITEATCTENGKLKKVCLVCKDEKEEVISASPDKHQFTEWQVLAKPTCTEKGQEFHYCEICLKSEIKKTLATGHVYGEYEIDTPASCGVTGYQHLECTVCGYEKAKEPIEALEHEFVGNTCKNNCGSKIYEYDKYGDNENEIIITKYNGSIKYDSTDAATIKATTYELYVPAEIDGKTVKAIGDNAFMMLVESEDNDGNKTVTAQTTGLTTVFIPDSVESIGDFAFANSMLKAVTLSENVTEIGKYAFGYTATAAYEEGTPEADEETDVTPVAEGDEATDTEEETTPVYELKVTEGTAVENFTIYGTKGTEAQAYAKDCDCDGKEETVAKVDFVYLSKVYSLAENNDYIKFEDENTLYVDSFELNEDGTGLKDPQAAQLTAMIEAMDNKTGEYKVVTNPTASYIDKDGNPVELFGTGSTLRVVDEDGIVVKEITIAIKGDVNGDGVYDAIDCMLVQLAITEASFTLEGAYYTAANCAQDSELNEEDLSGLVNKVLGVEDEPAEEETTVPSTEESTEASSEESTEESTEGESESVSVSESESVSVSESESVSVSESESVSVSESESVSVSESESVSVSESESVSVSE